MDITKNINLILIILLLSSIICFIYNNNEGYNNITINNIKFPSNLNSNINKILNYIATNYFNNKIILNELYNPSELNIDNLKNINEDIIKNDIQKIKDNIINLSFSDIQYLDSYAKIYRSTLNYFYISTNNPIKKKKIKLYLNIIDVGINELNKKILEKERLIDNNINSLTDNDIKQLFRTQACPIGQTYLNNYFTNKSTDAKCCPPGHKYLDSVCCPDDKINISKKKCCADNQELAVNRNLPISLQEVCCPNNSKNIGGECCPDSQSIGYSTCCPDNTNVTPPYDGGDGPTICCPPGKFNINGTCCDHVDKVNHNNKCYYPLVTGNS